MKYVIIGGGVAGTTVAENLQFFDETAQVTLVSATENVKKVHNLQRAGEVLASFDVLNTKPDTQQYTFICGIMVHVDFENKILSLDNGNMISYDRLCICSGAKPNILFPELPHVLGIRDTESVIKLQEKMQNCKHLTVVGNGGIASEFVVAANSCHITWVVKDSTISSTFVDSVASKFLLDSFIASNYSSDFPKSTVSKRRIYTTSTIKSSSGFQGSALGPDWYTGLSLKGNSTDKKIDIQYCTEIENISHTPHADYNLSIKLKNGVSIETDALISATGVLPNTGMFSGKLEISPIDGGILVNKRMETSIPGVFAAGDVCHIPWKCSENWKQMRLWTQALHQGFYVARTMATPKEEEKFLSPDISFEMFSHSTKLFGFKVILLGCHQEWEGCDCYFRINDGVEFVKVVVSNGRVQGALLIGETELEEVMENLILNQLDISSLGESILDPNVDIDDYFD